MFPRFTQALKNTFHQRHVVQDEVKEWQQFQTWYATSLGKRLLRSEKKVFDQHLPDLFGYFLLQCGCPEVKAEQSAGKWLKSSRISSKICLDYELNQGVSCQGQFDQLAIKSDSLDVVVLPHVLDFSASPHEVLREVERVLIAEGHVVILGFNPWSIWNLFRFLLVWTHQPPWNARFLASARVMDWLALLGFEVIKREGYFYRPPFQRSPLMKKMQFLERIGPRFWPKLGAGYVLVARKRVQTLTPIRPRWRTQRQVITSGLESLNRNKL